MEDLPIWVQTLLVLVSSFLFIYLKTINLFHVVDRNVTKAVLSGILVGLLWLISMSLGVNAILKGHIITVVAHIIAGALGTYTAITLDKKKNYEKDIDLGP